MSIYCLSSDLSSNSEESTNSSSSESSSSLDTKFRRLYELVIAKLQKRK